jgi:hypothetical protein
MGLEALTGPACDSDAISPTNFKVCCLPLQVNQRVNRETLRLYQRLIERWYRRLEAVDDWLANLNFGTARWRVIGFIPNIRFDHDASLSTLFSRQDMGAMHDLKLETVSQTRNSFVLESLLEPMDKQGRAYWVVGAEGLRSPKSA